MPQDTSKVTMSNARLQSFINTCQANQGMHAEVQAPKGPVTIAQAEKANKLGG